MRKDNYPLFKLVVLTPVRWRWKIPKVKRFATARTYPRRNIVFFYGPLALYLYRSTNDAFMEEHQR